MAAIFFVNGALFANWVARVPAVKDAIDTGTGALGLALLGIAAGSLVTMPRAGHICDRIGSRRAVTASALASAVALSAPALAPNPVLLGLALAGFGAAFGLLDVAMNVQGVAVVRRVGRPVMPQFHAAFSFGGLVGAATGGLAAKVGLSPAWHFAIVGSAAVVVVLVAHQFLLPDEISTPQPTPATVEGTARRSRRTRLLLVGLGGIATCAAIGEGAMADWSALFLRDVRGLEDGLAALGFAAFSIAMTAGRLGGEGAVRLVGPSRVLRLGGMVAATGLVLAVALASPLAGMVGFALVGLGLSCAFPLALSAAGESVDGSGGNEIATVSVIGYLGFLVGPPLIGVLAEIVGLRGAVLALALPALALATLARVMDAAADRGRPTAVAEPVTSVPGDRPAGLARCP